MTDWGKIYNEIKKADSIMLTTHENPDGDGVGSMMALTQHLDTHNKKYRILIPTNLSDEYKFIDANKKIEVFDKEKHCKYIENVDLAILLDIGKHSRTGDMWPLIQENGTTTINIDHHPYPNGHPFTINVADITAAATGELIYKYLQEVDPNSFSKKTYEAIYLAVMTDTGSFSYNNTNELSHEIAANAIKSGVNTTRIHQYIYGSSSRARIRLLAAVASNIQFAFDNKLAWFKITKKMMDAANASNSDVEGFTDFARTIKGVEVALMVFENNDNTCRINFRSTGKYSINKIAFYFDGGGHPFAAGAKVTGGLTEVVPRVVNKTIEILTEQDEARA